MGIYPDYPDPENIDPIEPQCVLRIFRLEIEHQPKSPHRKIFLGLMVNRGENRHHSKCITAVEKLHAFLNQSGHIKLPINASKHKIQEF